MVINVWCSLCLYRRRGGDAFCARSAVSHITVQEAVLSGKTSPQSETTHRSNVFVAIIAIVLKAQLWYSMYEDPSHCDTAGLESRKARNN